MRKLVVTVLTGTLVAGVGDGLPVMAQSEPQLHFVVRANRYYDGMYTNAPAGDARHVYFVDEPIDVVVDIGNSGASEQSIDTRAVSIREAFEVAQVKGPNRGPGRLELSETGEVALGDNQPDVKWGQVIALAPRAHVEWEGQFKGPAAPGYYEWRIEPKGVRSSTPINGLGTVLQYEVRVVASFEDRAEVARRRLIRAFDEENDVQTEAAARELLSLYPQSALAFDLRGRMAERLGRMKEAENAYRTALTSLADGKDRLFLAHTSAQDAARVLGDLKNASARVRAAN